MAQIVAGLGHGGADLGADLDLAIHEFGADLLLQLDLTGLEELWRAFGQSKAIEIDEKIFFFDADGEIGFSYGHYTPHTSVFLGNSVMAALPRKFVPQPRWRITTTPNRTMAAKVMNEPRMAIP